MSSVAIAVDVDVDVVLPDNWAFAMLVKMGGRSQPIWVGAFFPSTVTKVYILFSIQYNVQFVDGDQESGMEWNGTRLA